jgi:hypothetical protein
LDDAEVPAPLRHLVWITVERGPEGAEEAARQIADTLHMRDLRPAVADPPKYAATRAIPGLTSADTTLLAILAEEAIEGVSLLATGWHSISAKAEVGGIAGNVLLTSLAVLVQRRYAKARYVAGIPHRIELTSLGFNRVVDMVVPGTEQARQTIVLTLVNEPPTGTSAAEALAEATGTPLLFVVEYLKQLSSRGYLGLSQAIGGSSRVHSISPALGRLVES